MQYFERHWIVRVLDERRDKLDKGGVFMLEELHRLVWREEVLLSGRGWGGIGEGEEIARAVAVLKKGGRDRELVDGFEVSL